MSEFYDEATGLLSIVNIEMEAEFKVATHNAVESNSMEFKFYGFTIETSVALDVVEQINKLRTYH